MKTQHRIVALATDNPNLFTVKVKTNSGLAMYQVRARDSKTAVSRYCDPAFSTCIGNLCYTGLMV